MSWGSHAGRTLCVPVVEDDDLSRRDCPFGRRGLLQEAIADYNQSLNLDARQVNVYLSRANAFIDADKVQNAIIDLQVVFSLDRNCDKAYRLRANICIRLKEYSQAIDYLKQAGKIYLDRQEKESCRFCIARIRQIEQQKIAEQGGVTNQIFLQQIQQKGCAIQEKQKFGIGQKLFMTSSAIGGSLAVGIAFNYFHYQFDSVSI